MIDVPELVRDGTLLCVVSMSGGKDSTATALALREAGVPFRMVFADTGWEAPETYAHLDHLRKVIGPIETVGVHDGMVGRVRDRAGFPARMQRWCTRTLKIVPLREYHDTLSEAEGIETVCVVGIRHAESDSRAKMIPFEDEPAGDRSWGGWVWRPIITWDVRDVYAIHHRHGVGVNPLYKRGHDRVGCYPCIFANKDEIRLVAEHAPERIDQIRALEAEATAERARRNAAKPGRYKWADATYFQAKQATREGDYGMPIDDVVAWSKTARGGKQLQLIQEAPSGGCMRLGLCEPPTKAEE